MITARQARDIAHELGYSETQAAGMFRWFEFPSPRKMRELEAAAFVRVTYYEPLGDMQAIVFGQRGSPHARQSVFEGYIESAEQFEEVLREAFKVRLFVAAEELVRWDDERLRTAPRGLIEQARSPRADERRSATHVLIDWLLERGVSF